MAKDKNRNQEISFDGVKQDQSERVRLYPADTGDRLAAARAAMKLSVKDIADSLKLNEEIIIAIEKRDYEQLYGVAYATGYVRAYANLLDLDPDELIRDDPALGIVKNLEAPSDPAIAPSRNKKSVSKSWGAIFVRGMIIGIATIVIAAVWTQKDAMVALWNDIMNQEGTTEQSAPSPATSEPATGNPEPQPEAANTDNVQP